MLSLSGALVEGGLHDDRLDVLAAAVDEELRPHGRHRRWEIAEPDGLANGGPGASARADADCLAPFVAQRIAVARDSSAGDLEADELARQRLRFHLLERGLAHEHRLVHLD